MPGIAPCPWAPRRRAGGSSAGRESAVQAWRSGSFFEATSGWRCGSRWWPRLTCRLSAAMVRQTLRPEASRGVTPEAADEGPISRSRTQATALTFSPLAPGKITHEGRRLGDRRTPPPADDSSAGSRKRHPAVQIMADGHSDAAALRAHRQLGELEDLPALLHSLRSSAEKPDSSVLPWCATVLPA